MEVTVKGDPKEIAALVVALQERRPNQETPANVIHQILEQMSKKSREGGTNLLVV